MTSPRLDHTPVSAALVTASALLIQLASQLPAQQFLEAARRHVPAQFVGHVAVADLDGNGTPDLAGIGLADELRLLINDSTGAFADIPVPLPLTPFQQWRMVGIGDTDGDGTPEIFEAFPGQMFRTSLAPAVPQTVHSVDGDCWGLEFADLDGDSFDDVIALCADAVNIYWGGPAGPAARDRYVINVWRGHALGDYDSDGDLDIVIPGGTTGCDALRNDGLRSFSLQSIALTGVSSHSGATIADLDGDGTQDLVLEMGPFNALGTANVYRGTGGGAFALHRQLSLPDGRGPKVGDIDGDGDLDLVGQEDDAVVMFHNDGLANFSRVTGATFARLTAVEQLIDLDGDGDLDLVGRDDAGQLPIDGSLRLLQNDGNGNFFDDHHEPVTAGKLVDLNGDGNVDLWTENGTWLGDGHGEFPTPLAQSLPEGLFGDIDGDGDIDLLRSVSWEFHVWLNDGTGVFSLAVQQFVGLGQANGRVLADLDDDGDLDVVSRAILGSSRLWLWNGAGFDAGQALPQPFFSAIAADADGDGDLDLLSDSWALRNDGNGSFTDVTASWWPLGFPGGLFAGAPDASDLDGDGDLDLVWLGTVFENLAPGFVDRGATWLPATAQLPQRSLDVDLDGDADIVAVQTTPAGRIAGLQVLRNQGNGVFVDAGTDPLTAAAFGIQIADADGDDDPDLFLMGLESATLMVNLHRHLHARRAPEAGHVFELDLYARPGYPLPDFGFVGVSIGSMPTPTVLPQGNLWLDPLLTVVPLIAPLPAGRATAQLTFPATRMFDGLPIHAQGWVFPGDDHLTNLERTQLRH